MTTTTSTLSPVYPLGTRVNERGRLEIGGCDTVELAREFGTPAYVGGQGDPRTRARAGRGGRGRPAATGAGVRRCAVGPACRPRRPVRVEGVSMHRRLPAAGGGGAGL